MKIEDYSTNIEFIFHDIRKQGYSKPVVHSLLINNLPSNIEYLPLVRGVINCTNAYFNTTSILGFKSGSYYTDGIRVLNFTHNNNVWGWRELDPFKWKVFHDGPYNRTYKLANKDEFINYLISLHGYINYLKGRIS